MTSLAGSPVELAPPATAISGTPFSRAVSSETTLLKPNWFSPASTAGTIAEPPWAGAGVISRPREVKKPFWMPR